MTRPEHTVRDYVRQEYLVDVERERCLAALDELVAERDRLAAELEACNAARRLERLDKPIVSVDEGSEG